VPDPSPPQDNPLGFEADTVQGIPILRFQNAKILTDRSVLEMGNRIVASIDSLPDPPRLVISFEGIQFLSSAGIGKLIMIQRKVKERGGELVLCDMNSTTQDAFRVARLQDFFKFRPDVPSAVESLARS